jgi:hypothetical protein
MPFATTIGDSSLEGAGGFLIALGFWWYNCFPDEVIQHTLHFRSNNNDGKLVSIHVLEFVMVTINYCAALHVVWTSPITDDPHPGILNVTDNSSPMSWTLHTCKGSKIGQLLACFLCSLLINLPLCINSLKEYARAEGVSAKLGVALELVIDLSCENGVSETAEYCEKVPRTSMRPHVDLVPSGNGTGTHLTHADT